MPTSIDLDKKYIWHPYTSQYNVKDVIKVSKAKKEFIFDDQGNKYIDAISSWWTNLHGHNHKTINKAITEQVNTMEHVIFAGFTHQPAIDLSVALLNTLACNQQKIFFSDNGSTAVEVGLKIAIQYWENKNQPQRKKIIALTHAYHGDTFGTMSVGERGIFSAPFRNYLFDVIFIPDLTCNLEKDVLKHLQSIIAENEHDIAAFIFEPLIQGSAGMKMYSPELLNAILKVCKHHEILLIADEVMTGFGRTGKYFAAHYLDIAPDIFCLSKGLTGGYMAMGVTTCNEKIFKAFDSEKVAHTFYHGHSFTANPMACAASLASLKILKTADTQKRIENIHQSLIKFQTEIKNKYGLDSRCFGTIWAIDFETSKTSYHHHLRNKMYDYFIANKILLRPLGNTLYILPPYCISQKSLNYIFHHIKLFIENHT